MSNSLSSPRLRRVGNSTYEVSVDGVVVGTVWRTRYGWSARTVAGTLATEDYPGSRGVAVGVLVSARRDEVAR